MHMEDLARVTYAANVYTIGQMSALTEKSLVIAVVIDVNQKKSWSSIQS